MAELYYVEDDPDIAESVKEYLQSRGLQVSVFPAIEEAKRALRKREPSLVLIDRNMPDGSGEELCRWIRSRAGQALPILYLTVRGEVADVVGGFRDGADDYVTKPFEPEVLYARIRALLRRAGDVREERLCCGDLVLDREKKTAYCGQEEVPLSRPEYQLFEALMENKGRTVTRSQLLERVWDSNGSFVNDNTLTVTMKRLREKLRNPSCLKTVRSFGYRMEEE